MRIRIGPVPENPSFRPEEEGGWHKLTEPAFGVLLVLSLSTAMVPGSGVLAAWAAVASLHRVDDPLRVVVTARTLLLSVVALIGLVVVHELALALVLPDWGSTADTTLGFWPEKLTPYVCYGAELRAIEVFWSG